VFDLTSDVKTSILGDIWSSNEAFENLTILCDEFGSRFAGTDGERPAVDFIASRLREYGLENVEADGFTYTGWKRGDAKLEMLSPRERELETISLAMCPPTPPRSRGGHRLPRPRVPRALHRENGRDRGQDRAVHESAEALGRDGPPEDEVRLRR
jgi:hypothetical protein